MDAHSHSPPDLAESEPQRESPSPRSPGSAPAPAPVRPPVQKASHASLWTWIIILALIGTGWALREKWLPLVKRYLPGTAAPARKGGPREVPVVTAAARTRDINIYLNGLGTVTAFQSVTVRSRVEGELINVAFTEGQMVREGDLLAEIDPRPYEVQLTQAQGQLTRDEATHNAAELTLKRYKQLQATKTITAQEVDEQTAVVQQSAGTIQTDRGLVDNAKLQLTYCKITSPISGRIGLRLVDKGNMVRTNDVNGLAVITQLQPIALVFSIPQDEIVRLQTKINAGKKLEVYAFDRDLKVKIATGTLGAVDNQVDPMTGTVKLKAVFENKDNTLFPNQFVNARLLLDTLKDALVVPTAAIQRGPNGAFVYVVSAEHTVDVRMIEAGQAEGQETEIKKGLAAGEIVVTEGLDKLQPKAKVTISDKNKTDKNNADKSKAPSADAKSPSNSGKEAPVAPDAKSSPAATSAPVEKKPDTSKSDTPKQGSAKATP